MEILQIILTIVILIMIIYFIMWLFSKTTQLTKMSDGNIQQIILAKTISNNNNKLVKAATSRTNSALKGLIVGVV